MQFIECVFWKKTTIESVLYCPEPCFLCRNGLWKHWNNQWRRGHVLPIPSTCLLLLCFRYIVIDNLQFVISLFLPLSLCLQVHCHRFLQIANCLLCFKCGIWLVWTDDVYILLLKWKCFDRRNSICQHGRGQSLRKMLKVDWFMQGKHFDWIDAHWGGHFHFLIWSWCILKRAL